MSSRLFEARGESISTLATSERFEAGVHDVPFDATGLPTRYYVARLIAGDRALSDPIILTK